MLTIIKSINRLFSFFPIFKQLYTYNMRFRGMMHDLSAINQFHRLLWTLSKLVKSSADVFVLRLTPSAVFFIKSESAVNGGVTVWSRLSANSAFDEYNFEGLSSVDNEIQLVIVPSTLDQAFKTALAGSTAPSNHYSTSSRSLSSSNAKSLKMKLTKKQPQGPCLTIEVELPSAGAANRTRVLTQEIPVHVVARRNWIVDADCRVGDYDIDVWLPPLKTLKNVVDKMKNLSHHVILVAEKNPGAASHTASIKLNVDNEFVSVTTTFNDLQRASSSDADSTLSTNSHGNPNDENAFAVRVDVRKLASFLTALQIPTDSVLASFRDNEALHLRIADQDFAFQFRLPAVAM